MDYQHDIVVIHNMLTDSTVRGMLEEFELEALNDAISALKTLQDMGDTMNRILREEHNPE